MMQASSLACIIIGASCSVVEFERQLYVPRGLSTGNLPHCGSQAHVRCVELGVVEEVDEVGSELQPESIGEREVLVHAHVDICVMWRTQPIELR